MTQDLQYHLSVQDGAVISETGTFFKAIPFEIISGTQTIQVLFTRNDHHHVIYRLFENGKALCDIDHPDYTPECPPEEIRSLFNPSQDPYSVIAALFHVLVSKGEPYKSYLEAHAPYSFEIKQPKVNLISA